MAMKDWKKGEIYKGFSWTKKGVGEIYINPYSLGTSGSTYALFIEYPNGNEETLRTNFKTKSQAIAFANQYMRTH